MEWLGANPLIKLKEPLHPYLWSKPTFLRNSAGKLFLESKRVGFRATGAAQALSRRPLPVNTLALLIDKICITHSHSKECTISVIVLK